MTYLKNVVTLEYDESLCTGCRMCLNVCPHGVFLMEKNKAYIGERDNCMECGACMLNCPSGAIKVDKGVGCAAAVIVSRLKGRSEISCDCEGRNDDSSSGGCCC